MVGSLNSDSDNQSNYSTVRSLEGIASVSNPHTAKDEVDFISNNSSTTKAPTKFPVFISSSKSPPNSNNIDPPEKFVRIRNSSLQMESADVDVCFK